MRPLLKKLVYRLGGPLWWVLGWVVPKDPRRVAVNAFPDFDDTTRALALAVRGTGRRLSVLTTRRDAPRPAWLEGMDAQVAYRFSLRGLWLYHRAKFVLYTHGVYAAWAPSSRQVVVNVWHGMPLKKIGLLDGKRPDELPRFHLTIASDERFQGIMAAAFGVPRERVLVADHPRLDMLRAGGGAAAVAGLPPHRRLAVWLPTYRASVVGDVRVDGDERANIFAGGGADLLARVDALCERHGVLCVVKPHPMAKVSREAFTAYRSLLLVDDAGLAACGLSLYELLGQADLLITDVSSVYFDYKVLGRPAVLFCPDLSAYASTRGFTAPIESLVSDPIVQTEEALLARLEGLFTAPRRAGAADEERRPVATLELLRRIGVAA